MFAPNVIGHEDVKLGLLRSIVGGDTQICAIHNRVIWRPIVTKVQEVGACLWSKRLNFNIVIQSRAYTNFGVQAELSSGAKLSSYELI